MSPGIRREVFHASEASKERALQIAERIRRAVQGLDIPLEDRRNVRVTVSAGIAQLEKEAGIEDLLSKADEALYQAKNQGRNRVHAG